MTPPYSHWPLANMQLAEDALVTEIQLLGSAFVTEMKVLEGALEASTRASPFTRAHVNCGLV